MKLYNIIDVQPDEKYALLVIMRNSDSPLLHLNVLERELKKKKFTGVALIDQILHSGNTNERFISVDFESDKIVKSSIQFANIPKNSVYRKKSSYLLKEESLLDGSILTNIQKRMIAKGIAI